MRIAFTAAPAMLFAGMAVAQGDGRPDARDPGAKVAPVEFRSAFEAYRPDSVQELRDWRRANEEAGAAGGHRHGQGPGAETSRPQPGKPGSPGGPPEKGGEHGGRR